MPQSLEDQYVIPKDTVMRVVWIAGVSVFVLLVYVVSDRITSKNTEVVINDCNKDSEELLSEVVIADISGAVNKPGVYELGYGSRVVDLLKKAEGMTSNANSKWVTRGLNMSEKLFDTQKVYIPFEWEGLEEDFAVADFVDASSSSKESTTKDDTTDGDSSDSGTVNVNKADKKALIGLKGIGEVYAERIIENRPYSSIEDLGEKCGISAKTLGSIKGEISF